LKQQTWPSAHVPSLHAIGGSGPPLDELLAWPPLLLLDELLAWPPLLLLDELPAWPPLLLDELLPWLLLDALVLVTPAPPLPPAPDVPDAPKRMSALETPPQDTPAAPAQTRPPTAQSRAMDRPFICDKRTRGACDVHGNPAQSRAFAPSRGPRSCASGGRLPGAPVRGATSQDGRARDGTPARDGRAHAFFFTTSAAKADAGVPEGKAGVVEGGACRNASARRRVMATHGAAGIRREARPPSAWSASHDGTPSAVSRVGSWPHGLRGTSSSGVE
jgi:hypothetical protein